MSKKEKNGVGQDEIACRLKTSIGGQALIEGIMMRGPKTTAMAVRNPEGEIVLEEWPTVATKRAKIFKLPFIRGIFNFIDSMRFGYKCLMRSAEIAGLDDEPSKKDTQKVQEEAQEAAAEDLPEILTDQTESVEEEVSVTEQANEPAEESTTTEAPEAQPKKEESTSPLMKVLMVISTLLGVALAVTLFIWLPAQIYEWLPDEYFPTANEGRYLRSAFEGICRMVLLIAYMAAVSLMKDIRRTYMFHGAEHKTIFCYEAGLELTVENIRKQRRFHPRCGTSFLMLMVLVSIVIGFLIPPDWEMWLRVPIKLALIPVIVGVGYELLKLAGRHDNIVTRIISAPGLLLQRLTVYEPTDDMIECAIAAMKKAIPEDGSDRI